MKNKKNIWIYTLAIMVILFIVAYSCKKDETIMQIPVIATLPVRNVTPYKATCGGNITSNGGSKITVSGLCWGLNPAPTIADNKTTDGTSTGLFLSDMTGLSPNITYYARPYATNSVGTGYGDAALIKTLQKTIVTTSSVINIKDTIATCGGIINFSENSNIISRGVCWSIEPLPTIIGNKTIDKGTGTSYTNIISGLKPFTTYYVRAYALLSDTTEYGNIVSFKTIQIPILESLGITDIGQTTAMVDGNILSDGGSLSFNRGVCWSTKVFPTNADKNIILGGATGSISYNLNGLRTNTTYYVRAFATNFAGTGYGNQLTFTTQDYGTVNDITGNVYKTIIIGTQTWMAENLNTHHYSNGDYIQNVGGSEWIGLTTGALCEYNNLPTNGEKYGKLYNFYAVSDSRGLCPTGWHVPVETEWNTLTDYLDKNYPAAAKAMCDTLGWHLSNIINTPGYKQLDNNYSGFSALPTGTRFINGSYGNLSYAGYWWSASLSDPNEGLDIYLNAAFTNIFRGDSPKFIGKSVRCLKDLNKY
jgi:uncharacterized protein (TIGR02145 family)